MMLSSPYQNPVSQFTIPETPRTEASSQMNLLMSTPKKNKSRKLKIISEALATEKASRLKDMKRTIDDEIIEQEVRRDKYQQLKRPKLMSDMPLRIEEEKK